MSTHLMYTVHVKHVNLYLLSLRQSVHKKIMLHAFKDFKLIYSNCCIHTCTCMCTLKELEIIFLNTLTCFIWNDIHIMVFCDSETICWNLQVYSVFDLLFQFLFLLHI